MQLNKEPNANIQISSYNNQSITIGEKTFSQSFMLNSTGMHPIKSTSCVAETLQSEQLMQQLEGSIVLLGQKLINHNELLVVKKLYNTKQIALEAMNIGSACRTFNVLMQEGRQASLIILFE